jgi:hypothetical protein
MNEMVLELPVRCSGETGERRFLFTFCSAPHRNKAGREPDVWRQGRNQMHMDEPVLYVLGRAATCNSGSVEYGRI